jgi:hypothetical protein
MEVEETPGNISDEHGHLMTFIVGRQTKAAESVLQIVVSSPHHAGRCRAATNQSSSPSP